MTSRAFSPSCVTRLRLDANVRLRLYVAALPTSSSLPSGLWMNGCCTGDMTTSISPHRRRAIAPQGLGFRSSRRRESQPPSHPRDLRHECRVVELGEAVGSDEACPTFPCYVLRPSRDESCGRAMELWNRRRRLARPRSTRCCESGSGPSVGHRGGPRRATTGVGRPPNTPSRV